MYLKHYVIDSHCANFVCFSLTC
uniref:Uncharacterized protein n=1 Tax=Anguilla anguilla TaxID=7936 RepID=A0A0E9TNK0_ANGAN